MPELYQETILCRNCNQECDGKRCSKCHAVRYCGPQCQKADWTRHRAKCVPVLVKELEDRGRGLVAAKNISVGDLILADKAVIKVSGDADTWEAGAEIHKQVSKLSEYQRSEFFKLTKMEQLLDICETFIVAAGDDPDKVSKADAVRKYKNVTAIFYNNDISSEDDSKCLYLTLALLNHSCSPNSCWSQSVKDPSMMELRAIRDITQDEEITVSYICVEGRYSDTETRQGMLMKGWGFQCRCFLCESRSEDDLKLNIRNIKKEMILECEKSIDEIDWCLMALHQEKILDNVQKLSCAPLLLPRECQSLVNLAQLARKAQLQEKALDLWRMVIDKLNIERTRENYKMAKVQLSEWSSNLKNKSRPHRCEIEIFLWLM